MTPTNRFQNAPSLHPQATPVQEWVPEPKRPAKRLDGATLPKPEPKRHRHYLPEQQEMILEQIARMAAEGVSIYDICASNPSLPYKESVSRWLANSDALFKFYHDKIKFYESAGSLYRQARIKVRLRDVSGRLYLEASLNKACTAGVLPIAYGGPIEIVPPNLRGGGLRIWHLDCRPTATRILPNDGKPSRFLSAYAPNLSLFHIVKHSEPGSFGSGAGTVGTVSELIFGIGERVEEGYYKLVRML